MSLVSGEPIASHDGGGNGGVAMGETAAAASPLKKKLRKSVHIAEDRNEIALILPVAANPSASSSTTTTKTAAVSSDVLLAQAEKQAANRNSRVVPLTVAGVKNAAVALRKATEANALQRAKGGTSAAETYMESELALYEQIASFKAFVAVDDVAALYPTLQMESMSDLVQLLLHDNVDIAIAVTAVFLEWLDPSLLLDRQSLNQENDMSNRNSKKHINTVTAVASMAAAVLLQGAELLVDNIARMDASNNNNKKDAVDDDDNNDDDDEVGRGVDDILTLFENLLEIDTAVFAIQQERIMANGMSVAAILCKETFLVSWMFAQIQKKDATGPYRIRCMELISILAPKEEVYSVLSDWSRLPMYSSPHDNAQKQTGVVVSSKESCMDGVEILLQCIADFRKRQPLNEMEVEFLENASMTVASLLTFSAEAVQAFLDAQGVELVMRCLKECVYAGATTLKWLDFSGSHAVYRQACEHLVQAGALKFLFPLFMGRNLPQYPSKTGTAKQKKAKREFLHSIEATSIRILYALVRHLRVDSPNDARERVLAKFVDSGDLGQSSDRTADENKKVNRLVELLLAYDQRARIAEYKFFQSDAEDALLLNGGSNSTPANADESIVALAALETKMAAGGDIFHQLAAIAAFCCTGSKLCYEQILTSLHAQESGIGLTHAALEEFASVLDDASDQKKQIESFLKQIKST